MTGGEVAGLGRIAAVRGRLEQASDLAGVLDAAYEAFEAMLAVIHGQEDRAGAGFAAFVMSAASAANGRDAVAAAPSLPSAVAPGGLLAAGGLAADVSEDEAAAAVALLSRLLAGPAGGCCRMGGAGRGPGSVRGRGPARRGDLVAAGRGAAAVSSGATFGDFAGAASAHLDHAVPPAELAGRRMDAVARGRQIEEFARGLRGVLEVLAAYLAEITAPVAGVPARDRGLLTVWARAGAEAEDALGRAIESLPPDGRDSAGHGRAGTAGRHPAGWMRRPRRCGPGGICCGRTRGRGRMAGGGITRSGRRW